MPNKLDIELYQYRTLLFGRVLHMDESLRRGNLKSPKVLSEYMGFVIKSDERPNLYENALYVRGNGTTCDKNVFLRNFIDEKKAQETYDKLKKCLDIINLVEPPNENVSELLVKLL